MKRDALKKFPMYRSCALVYLSTALLWLVLAGPCLASNAVQNQEDVQDTIDQSSKDQVEGAASEPEAVSVAEPNIGALLGIGSLGGNQRLLSGFNPRSLTGGLNLPASIHNVPDLRNICSNGNPDALTNLLVYQYLSGALPNGAAGLPKVPNPGAASNLQALFEGQVHESTLKTSTTVTTGLTTRTLSLEPKTHFSTSTSIYVTTITAVSTTIIPILFRGSTITTTITEKKTEVLTATEFLTKSTVLKPSIVQTLPLEITLIHKSTLGLNGRYTLDHVAPGATRVIEQPINTASFGLKSHGIDLSSIDFSSADLKGLNEGDADMLNALSALLEQYSDGPIEPKRNDRYQLRREKSKSSRFQDRHRVHENDENPKISVIKGFTLRDREQRPRQKERSTSGTAALNTRYSKFLKKDKLKNNSLQSKEPDRESEPFSASTSRRTVSSAQRRRNVPPHAFQRSSRFQPTGRSINSGSSSGGSSSDRVAATRRNRQIEKRVSSRSGRTLRVRTAQRRNAFNAIQVSQHIKTTTAVLTLRIHGSRFGLIRTVLRTVTLGTFDASQRLRRHITTSDPQPLEKIVQTETFMPAITPDITPEDVVKLLKKVDKKNVEVMLGSLKNWVDYYMKEVLEEGEGTSIFSKYHKDFVTNDIPELSSSIAKDVLEAHESVVTEATAALPSLPHQLTKTPSITESSSQALCLKPHTLTTTVYKTLYLSQP